MVQLATVDGEVVSDLIVAAPVTGPLLEADHLDKLVRYFEESEEATREARQKSEQDRDYYDGKQWTAEEIATLRKRGQPPLVINRVRQKTDLLRGLERRSRTDPKAYPRNPQDESGANAATDALRFVADQNDFDISRSNVYTNLIIEGYGGVDVTVEELPNAETMINIVQVPWDRIFFDPHSRYGDFSDAKYKGVVIWMDRDEAFDIYGDRRDAIEATFSSVSDTGTFEDRPHNNMWADNRRTRVRVVQMHYIWRGDWYVATFTKGGFLVNPTVSPYKDKLGRSASSLVLQSAYIDRDNNRYGHVRDLISPQDELNKRRSKMLHLMNSRQTFANAHAVEDQRAAKRELQKPDGHIELNSGAQFGQDFGVIPTTDMAMGQYQLLQNINQELQAIGPNAALSGKDPRQQSGRAILAQQQGGATEVEPINDDLRQWTRRVYEQVWMCVRQYWTAEKWVRVTDDERNIKWVGLNKKITVKDKLDQMPPMVREQAIMVAAQQFQMNPQDPALLDQPVAIENDVSGLDVDIVIEEGPDLASLQIEQYEMLVQLASTPQGQTQIPLVEIIRASNLRNKDAMIERMEQAQQQQQQAQQQQMQMAQQSQQQAAQFEQQKQAREDAETQADIITSVATARNKDADTMQKEQEIAMNRLMPVNAPPMLY